MFYHKCIPNFADINDEKLSTKVLDEVIKFNSSTLKLNIESKITKAQVTVEEGYRTQIKSTWYPHVGNMFNYEESIPKICAYFIISNRDYVQGGEFEFGHWNDPQRVDNFGKIIGDSDNNYPLDLNEQGSLIILPALEPMGTKLVVSGTLEYYKFIVKGDNYS